MGLLACCSGCGEAAPPEGQVFGKVTFRGQPVTEGTISFQSPSGYGGEDELDPDGSYRLPSGVAVGEYQVAVVPPQVMDSSDPHTPPVRVFKKMDNIPKKYHLIATSQLTASVKEGDNSLDFDLK